MELEEIDQCFFNLHDGVALLDEKLKLKYINPSFESLFALSQSALLGKKITKIFPAHVKVFQKISETFASRTSFSLLDIEFSPKHGKKLKVDLTGAHLKNRKGTLVFFRDRSSLKFSDEEKRAYDRLAMMGTLASGLAHEIKNPLSGIRASAEMIRREIKDEDLIEFTEIIVSEVDRLNSLMVNLLDFSQPKNQKLSSVNINKVANEIFILQKERLKEKAITCILELDPSLPLVLGNEDSLKQAALNFLNNAIEAIEKDGKVVISSRINQAYHYKAEDGKSNSMVELSIKDNGCGIKEEDKKNLFTPFFTSKQGGNGLGLMISQKIASDMGGHLKIRSEEGKGTIVSLLLRRF